MDCARGHLGLATFQHVLTDSRIHNIPIVLETEGFEKDEVWEKEIEVLNRLSSAGRVNDDGSDAHGHGKKFLQELVGEVKKVVNTAAGASKKTAKPAKGKKKGHPDDEE
jgi:AP endonuclease-1